MQVTQALIRHWQQITAEIATVDGERTHAWAQLGDRVGIIDCGTRVLLIDSNFRELGEELRGAVA